MTGVRHGSRSFRSGEFYFYAVDRRSDALQLQRISRSFRAKRRCLPRFRSPAAHLTRNRYRPNRSRQATSPRAQNQIVSLRSALGASAATFRGAGATACSMPATRRSKGNGRSVSSPDLASGAGLLTERWDGTSIAGFENGFARVRCGDCHKDMLVAFSCKGRGLCPSCAAKRAAETANRLREDVLEPVGHAQWVFTLWSQMSQVMVSRAAEAGTESRSREVTDRTTASDARRGRSCRQVS